eukprot:1158365-Pelagomonas_calceolata.AAC.14
MVLPRQGHTLKLIKSKPTDILQAGQPGSAGKARVIQDLHRERSRVLAASIGGRIATEPCESPNSLQNF